jgi:hypothetical protein
LGVELGNPSSTHHEKVSNVVRSPCAPDFTAIFVRWRQLIRRSDIMNL